MKRRKSIIPKRELENLCEKNGWLKNATPSQINKIFMINDKFREYGTETLSVAIWVLSPDTKPREIQFELARTINKEYPVKENSKVDTVKKHFADRNGISPENVFCEPAGTSKDGFELYRVKYLDQDKTIENAGEWITVLTVLSREHRQRSE